MKITMWVGVAVFLVGILIMGADAIVNVGFITSMVMTGAAEILAYGTAVKLK